MQERRDASRECPHFCLASFHDLIQSRRVSNQIGNAMKKHTLYTTILVAASVFAGCGTPNAEKGPHGTIAYFVQVESSEPGVRIEANNDYVGKTPLTLKIFGDKDGTFHNFGSYEYVVRAFPANTNQYIQTKVFRTGGRFTQEDMVPKRIYFDMSQKTSGFSIDLPPNR